MPVVQIENPFNKKVEQVEIAGEEPTEKELKDVIQDKLIYGLVSS